MGFGEQALAVRPRRIGTLPAQRSVSSGGGGGGGLCRILFRTGSMEQQKGEQ